MYGIEGSYRERNLFDKFLSPFIRRNESQIAVWHPAQFKTFSRMARGTGDKGGNMRGRGGGGHMVCRRPWRVYTIAPAETSNPYCHQRSRTVGGGRAESRFLILQYPHKILAITVKVDEG